MVRLLLLLLGTLTAGGPRPPATARRPDDWPDVEPEPDPTYPSPGGPPYQPVPVSGLLPCWWWAWYSARRSRRWC